jgi:hypothetical protein
VSYLVICYFAACKGSLILSIDRCGTVYVLCGDRLLVLICRGFLWKFCSFYVVVFICLRFPCVMAFPLVFLVVYGVVVDVFVMIVFVLTVITETTTPYTIKKTSRKLVTQGKPRTYD